MFLIILLIFCSFLFKSLNLLSHIIKTKIIQALNNRIEKIFHFNTKFTRDKPRGINMNNEKEINAKIK